MKVKMYTSIMEEEWKQRFMTDGIKAGEVEGEANGERMILCQHVPFAYDTTGRRFAVLEFMKELGEILVDHDDDVEAAEILAEDAHTYGQLTPEQIKGLSLYGACVKEVQQNEIVNVRWAHWEDVDGIVFE